MPEHAASRDQIVHADPDVLGGTTVFLGTRVPFSTFIEYLEAGDSLADLPSLGCDRVVASLEILRQLMDGRSARRAAAPVATIVAAVLTACAPLLPTGHGDFAELVHSKVSVGDPAEQATIAMRELGFHVSDPQRASNTLEQRRLVFCSRTSHPLPLMDREWRVLLYLEDDLVAEIVPQINITAP